MAVTRMQQRRGTAAAWAGTNPILSEGELGIETDTRILKVGDGITPWLDLEPIFTPDNGTESGFNKYQAATGQPYIDSGKIYVGEDYPLNPTDGSLLFKPVAL